MKYLIMTLIFLALAKLLQVTIFDGEKYNSLQKSHDEKFINSDLKQSSKKKVAKTTEKISEPSSKKGSQKKPSKQDSAIGPEGEKALNNLKENYLNPIMENIPVDDLREDVFIRYYRHDKDGIGIYKLEEMGYYIHQKPASETAGLGSNTIYYGDDVPLEDIQIIALTLLKEGIPVKTIKHTKFAWKSSAIEIGTDASINDEPNISVEEILDFNKQYLGGSN